MESGKQRLDCACAVGLGFGPLVFTLWASLGALGIFNVFLTSFDVPLGPYFTSPEKSGGRGGTQLIEYKNTALATCTSILCFRSATGPSTCSLVGRPSTRGRIYVACGEHPAAGGLFVFFGALGSNLMP